MNETTSIIPDTTNSNNQESQFSIPKWYSRLAAYLLDNLLLGIPLYLVLFIGLTLIGVGTVDLSDTITEISGIVFTIIWVLISISVSIIYFPYLQSKTGQTWGMKFIGIKIINENGNLLFFKDAFIRNLFITVIPSIIIFIPFIGNALNLIFFITLIIFILIDKNNQGFHDKMFKAIYITADEKIQRSKWTVGCYCGCFTFLFIIGISVAVIFGLNAFGDTINSLDKVNTEFNETKLPDKTQSNETQNSLPPVSEIPSNKISEPMESAEFYKICMKSNIDPNIDLTDYCGCAEREYEYLTPINEIPNKCREYIIRK